jgi:hypothetical protein
MLNPTKIAAEVGSPKTLTLKRQRELEYAQDAAAQKQAAKTIIVAFVGTARKLRDRIGQNLTDRELVRVLKADPEVQTFLKDFVGPDIKSRHQTVIYRFRDAIQGKTDAKALGEDLGRLTESSYYADAVMLQKRAPLIEAIGEEFLDFFPSNMIVDLDPEGQIREITERFNHVGETIDVKQQRMVGLLDILDDLRDIVRTDLRGSFGTLKHAQAMVVALMLEAGIRPGADQNGVWFDPDTNKILRGVRALESAPNKVWVKTYGATDLETTHLQFSGGSVALDFQGKMGSQNRAVISDPITVRSLKQYYNRAIQDGVLRVIRTLDGASLTPGQVAAYCAKYNFRPTDLRKLRATTSVYENLKSEQAQLYAELRKISKSKDLRLKVVSAVQNMVLRALQKSQSDLSHDEFETTVSNYINPAVLLRFLSTGRLDDTLSNMVLAGKTTVRFDPKVFIQAAMEV